MAGAVSMDADDADQNGVTVSEYNRWLVQEENWQSAEEARTQYMEGEQFRKLREERHRERGTERQANSIEQMKTVKAKVEEHRQANLEQGKVSTVPAERAAPQPLLDAPGSRHLTDEELTCYHFVHTAGGARGRGALEAGAIRFAGAVAGEG